MTTVISLLAPGTKKTWLRHWP